MKTAIVYHYFELDETYRDNLIYFLNCGIDEHADYFIFIAGDCSADLPAHPNVNYFHIKNENNDFGSIIEFFAKIQSRRDLIIMYLSIVLLVAHSSQLITASLGTKHSHQGY